MMEPRKYSPAELLAWSRLAGLTLVGLALAYARERDGSVDEFVDFASARLAESWGAPAGGGVEVALLGLLLNAEALGADVLSRAMNPEEAEAVLSDLPGERVVRDLDDRFEVQLTAEDVLAAAGVNQAEMNRVYDMIGAAAAAAGVEYRREPAAAVGQRIVLRTW
ncbi:MAG TPA: hypothetical protein VFN57_02720 [Thermomicrobiaceae bacterium]|nr:hypothetical protein [Thermomicrobiaceae bacterium]